MKNFLVIDGNSIMNRAFYGISSSRMLSNSSGIYTNAIYGFLNIYWMILDKYKNDYVAVSFDLKAPTFRHKMYTEYKGTRKQMPEELAQQMPIIKKVLNAMNIPIFELEGYEADDILGTVANINTQNDIFTYILTGDRDSFQLISPHTSIIIPTTKMGKTEYTTYTPELLMEKYNITPEQVTDVKALMGDASDNIPGVKGIGEKTAYSLINDYNSIENIYENIEDITVTASVKSKLIEGKEMSFLSKELATIDVNVPINLDYNSCLVTDVDKPKLYELFKELEFNKFMSKYDFSDLDNKEERTMSTLNSRAKEISSVKETIIINSKNIDKYIDTINTVFTNDKISYILSGIDVPGFVSVLGLNKSTIFSFYDSTNDIIYIIDINDIKNYRKDLEKEILKSFATSFSTKLGYNVKEDILYLFNNITNNISKFNFDIMIAYYLMDANRSSYPIEYILKDIYDINVETIKTEPEQVQISLFDSLNTDTNKEFLSKNDILNITIYLKGIYFAYEEVLEKLNKLEMLRLFNEVEMPLAETLAFMEHTGMYIDLKKLDEFNSEITLSLKKLEAEIFELAGETFNINSTQQLGEILFEKLKLPTVKKNKKGYSTDKTVLDELAEYHPIIEKIIDYRQTMKLKTTFVDGLRTKIASDGRIHTTFMQTVTSTGRLSSVEPNLQNIPIRLELGSKIRTFFVGENDNLIMDSDYSQIELRVLAHISHDENMINAFKNNIDIHKVTASQVFGVNLEDVTSTMRSQAKAVNFGIVYGISEFGLAKNINTSRKEASQYIHNYLNTYQGIQNFMTDIVEEAKNNGYVSTMFGRRRYIPEITQKNRNIAQFGERVALNTPIQGTAADIIKLAMNKIYLAMKARNLKSKLIMQVHDELIIETVPDEVEIVKSIMYDAMEHIIELDVPLDIDLNVGKSWFEAK